MTRFGRIKAHRVEGFGCEAFRVEGTPADCVNLGIYNLFDSPPDWVVAGVNIGFNWGVNLAINSGTVGAALEAALVGLPAVAFSQDVPGPMYYEWVTHSRISGPEAQGLIASAAQRAAGMTAALLAHGLPPEAMMLNVNFPKGLTPTTPVRWVPLRNNRYGSLFVAEGDGYRHSYRGDTWAEDDGLDDFSVVNRGEVSVTPLNLNGLSVKNSPAIPF